MNNPPSPLLSERGDQTNLSRLKKDPDNRPQDGDRRLLLQALSALLNLFQRLFRLFH
jgi:hypothetical protein